MQSPPDRSLLPLVCAAGAAALVGQTVLVRELMVSFYGTELALAAVLCCWLAFVPVGALGAGVLLKAAKSKPGSAALPYFAVLAIALALPVEFVLARLARPLLGAEVGQFVSVGAMLVGAALPALVVAIPVGFLFPAASRFEERLAPRPAGGISRVYVAEALGSAAAGALLSLYLLGRHTPIALAFAAAVLLLFVAALSAAGASGRLCLVSSVSMAALLCWSGARREPALFFAPVALFAAVGCFVRWAAGRGRPLRLVPFAGCAALGLALCAAFLRWGGQLQDATQRARWSTFSTFRLVAALDTRYQHVELGERAGEYVLVQNGRQVGQFPDPAAAKAQTALILTQHARPQDVLVIGGGLGGLCQEMLESPVRRLDYVEPDPQLAVFLRERLPHELTRPLADPRFGAYAYDGRHFVQRLPKKSTGLMRGYLSAPGEAARGRHPRAPAGAYDLIVINVGDPTSAAGSRFYTAEFCGELSRALRPGGAVAFCGITASEDLARGGAVMQYTACIYRTLRSVFAHVVVRAGNRFCFFAAAEPNVVTSDPRILTDRFDALGLQPPVLKYRLERADFPPERTQWAARLLQESLPTALINTDERPVLFTLFLAVEAHYAREVRGARAADAPSQGSGLSSVLARAGAPRPGGLWLLLVIPPAALALLRMVVGRSSAAPWACRFSVFTSGLFGLSAEMLIVYGYQIKFGFVYRDVSIIVGVFMLGIALGGWAATRTPLGRGSGVLLALESAQTVLILILPAAGALLSFSPHAFMLLSPVAGFLTGAEFPLAARLSLTGGREPATVAATLNAADNLGALAGAACAGLLLIPALGVAQAAATLALVKCASLAGLVVSFAGLSGAARRHAGTPT
jgi:spermidine synthase